MVEVTNDTIFVDLVRCTGCWTCSMACKVGNNLPDETFWQTVRTLGSGEGIDRPAGIWPDLHESWIPLWSKDCIKCAGRTSRGELPYCVHSCPNHALTYGDAAIKMAEDLRQRGYRIFELPRFEQTHDGIAYASRG